MKHIRKVEIDCDTGLVSIVGIMVNGNDVERQRWNGKSWDDIEHGFKFNSYIMNILNEQD